MVSKYISLDVSRSEVLRIDLVEHIKQFNNYVKGNKPEHTRHRINFHCFNFNLNLSVVLDSHRLYQNFNLALSLYLKFWDSILAEELSTGDIEFLVNMFCGSRPGC